MDAKLEELNSNTDTLSSKVIKLLGVCIECTEITGTTSAPNLDSEEKGHDTKDDMHKLITHSRGIDEKLIFLGLDDWALVDAGFKCNTCSQTITHYHIIVGREFGKENLSSSFRNMKTSLICHLNSENHQKKYAALKMRKWGNKSLKIEKNVV